MTYLGVWVISLLLCFAGGVYYGKHLVSIGESIEYASAVAAKLTMALWFLSGVLMLGLWLVSK